MYSKLMWVLIGVLFFVFIPVKVTSVFSPLEFVDSGWFIILFFAILGLVYLVSKFSDVKIDNLKVSRSIPLGILSLVISVSFFFCMLSYDGTGNDNIYDFTWQPVAMSFLSILSVVTFLVMAITHFTGKNLFEKMSVFLFFPVLWFAFDMILFLSIQNENSDIYDISLTAFLALFFLYYTQVYSTASKQNIVKLLISFGIPSVVLMLMKFVPVAINYVSGQSNLPNKVEGATCVMEAIVGVYVLVVVVKSLIQVRKANKEK